MTPLELRVIKAARDYTYAARWWPENIEQIVDCAEVLFAAVEALNRTAPAAEPKAEQPIDYWPNTPANAGSHQDDDDARLAIAEAWIDLPDTTA